MSKVRCADCGTVFPNSHRVGHCGKGGCHETFVGLTAFDAHRVGQHGVNRRCEIREKHWQDDRGFWHYGPRDPRFD